MDDDIKLIINLAKFSIQFFNLKIEIYKFSILSKYLERFIVIEIVIMKKN